MTTIASVKPRSSYQHYSNPECQGSLIRQTALWPRQRVIRHGWTRSEWSGEDYPEENETAGGELPIGCDAGDAYLDRMRDWDREKLKVAWAHLSWGLDSPDDELIAFAKAYFAVDVVAVRTVFYFNVATGYPCERIDYIYKRAEKQEAAERPK